MPSSKMDVAKRVALGIAVKNEPGTLAGIFKILADGGVNVLAFCAFETSSTESFIHLVPDDGEQARRLLRAYEPGEDTVVAVSVDSTQGVGFKLSKTLADAGVNISYAYASTAGKGKSMAVFAVSEVDKAIKALRGVKSAARS